VKWIALGAELDLAKPVRPEVHQARTRNRCASSIVLLLPCPRISKLRGYPALVRQLEIHGDRGFYFHWFAIQQVWTVAPLLNRFQSAPLAPAVFWGGACRGRPTRNNCLTSGCLDSVAVLMETPNLPSFPGLQCVSIFPRSGFRRPCVKSRYSVIRITR